MINARFATDNIKRDYEDFLMNKDEKTRILEEENIKLRKELEIKNKELEEFVKELGNSYKEMITSYAQMEKSKLKAEFISSIAHELRSPLNAILGYSNLGLLGFDNCDSNSTSCKDAFKTIKEAGDHLLSIINAMLDIAKVEAGRLKFYEESFLLKELVNSTVTMLNADVERKNLILYSNIDNTVPEFIKTDRGKLRQILINILSNAIKFTSEGYICLSIRNFDEEDKNKILFIIEDTGIGIEKEYQKHIFNPFDQGRDNIALKFGGTGLGLAITKELVKMAGGKIWLESENKKVQLFILLLIIIHKLNPKSLKPRKK